MRFLWTTAAQVIRKERRKHWPAWRRLWINGGQIIFVYSPKSWSHCLQSRPSGRVRKNQTKRIWTGNKKRWKKHQGEPQRREPDMQYMSRVQFTNFIDVNWNTPTSNIGITEPPLPFSQPCDHFYGCFPKCSQAFCCSFNFELWSKSKACDKWAVVGVVGPQQQWSNVWCENASGDYNMTHLKLIRVSCHEARPWCSGPLPDSLSIVPLFYFASVLNAGLQ